MPIISIPPKLYLLQAMSSWTQLYQDIQIIRNKFKFDLLDLKKEIRTTEPPHEHQQFPINIQKPDQRAAAFQSNKNYELSFVHKFIPAIDTSNFSKIISEESANERNRQTKNITGNQNYVTITPAGDGRE